MYSSKIYSACWAQYDKALGRGQVTEVDYQLDLRDTYSGFRPVSLICESEGF